MSDVNSVPNSVQTVNQLPATHWKPNKIYAVDKDAGAVYDDPTASGFECQKYYAGMMTIDGKSIPSKHPTFKVLPPARKEPAAPPKKNAKSAMGKEIPPYKIEVTVEMLDGDPQVIEVTIPGGEARGALHFQVFDEAETKVKGVWKRMYCSRVESAEVIENFTAETAQAFRSWEQRKEVRDAKPADRSITFDQWKEWVVQQQAKATKLGLEFKHEDLLLILNEAQQKRFGGAVMKFSEWNDTLLAASAAVDADLAFRSITGDVPSENLLDPKDEEPIEGAIPPTAPDSREALTPPPPLSPLPPAPPPIAPPAPPVAAPPSNLTVIKGSDERAVAAPSDERDLNASRQIVVVKNSAAIIAHMMNKNILVENVDFGRIVKDDPNSKPSLFKAGAEKLVTAYDLYVVLHQLPHTISDWEKPLFYFHYQAEVGERSTGRVIARVNGSANSYESKYRYRWVPAHEVDPALNLATLKTRGGIYTEFAFAIDKAETAGQYGKPRDYWNMFESAIASGQATQIKKTSSKGKEMDAWQVNGLLYRVPNPDIYDVINTIDKMAQKRAFVAGVLIATGASSIFTQDLEDNPEFGYIFLDSKTA